MNIIWLYQTVVKVFEQKKSQIKALTFRICNCREAVSNMVLQDESVQFCNWDRKSEEQDNTTWDFVLIKHGFYLVGELLNMGPSVSNYFWKIIGC